MTKKQNYFYGEQVTINERENGVKTISYADLCKPFDCILCNDIANKYCDEMSIISGVDYDAETEEFFDIFQYYIISRSFVDCLQSYTDEIVYYVPSLDLYVWGVTHWGTSWSCVECELKNF